MAREGKEWGAVVVMSPSPPRHGARHGGRVNAASFSGGIVAGVAPTPPRFLTPATGFQLRSPSGSRYCQEPVVTHDFLNTRCRRRPNYGEVEEMIMKAAKMGQMSSQIGVVLRHQHGIPLVKSIASSKILHILKAHGLAPKILEDLYFLIKKAVAIRKHLERNRKDKDSSFRLILVESRIHRLVRYYKRTKKLPPTLRSWIIFLEFSTVFSCSLYFYKA
ncbi:hypothetical protein OsJ_07918 [Oryza sativa Japonica Group]|uniref:Small ribosomal subunit protein uS15 N-terminal domain-containing protein n=1 Tax=Oryza sativa subsp. japonica TaxID=39947 RepID=A3AA34_ORYSJ|nr:hypothetical protein OsJ_07918 [Oryza sativa Japonica Group]